MKHSARGRFFAARRLTGNGGAELVETGLVLTILLTLMVGVFWIGRAYNIYETITRAAREGARFAVSPSCATCGNAFPSDADVDTVINNALSASALNPAKVSPAITIQRNQTLDPSAPAANQVAGVIVTFGYPVQLFIPFTSLKSSSFTISTQVQMRQEF